MAGKRNLGIPADTAGNSGATAKARGKPFEKGKSGNPSGRPKLPEGLREIFKATAPEAARLLVEMMRDGSLKPELRKACAETIIERVYGKPTQPIDGNLDGKLVIELAGELEEYAG